MIHITVQDTVTGQIVVDEIDTGHTDADVESWIFYWCHRGFSSDHNRALLFGFSGDEPEWDTCGQPNRFRVLKIEKNGIPVDFPDYINDTDNAPPLPWL